MPAINLDLTKFDDLDHLYYLLEKADNKDNSLAIQSKQFEKDLMNFFVTRIQTDSPTDLPETALKILDLIEKIEKKSKKSFSFSEARHVLALLNTEYAQKHSAELLSSILDQKSLKPVLPHGQHQQQSEGSNFLPSNEYPPPEEPGHFSEVGINETFPFTDTKKAKQVLGSFSTESLITIFLEAFSWAVKNDPHKKASLKKASKDNILENENTLPPLIQFRTIQCLLLCFDALGKACGKKGERLPAHFDEIKLIAHLSKRLSDDLEYLAATQPNVYKAHLIDMMSTLQEKNRALLEEEKLTNPEMSQFCRTNESLSAQLLDLKEIKSVLTPSKGR